jgi:cytochrome c2
MECHSLVPTNSDTAPSLGEIYDSQVAGTSFNAYSEAMKSYSGRWSRELLAQYLDDPNQLISGTPMPNPNIRDEQVRNELIELLVAISTWAEAEK